MPPPTASVDLYNTGGRTASSQLCTAQLDNGGIYVFNKVPELLRHPSDRDTCILRTMAYPDGVVQPDLSDCGSSSSLLINRGVINKIYRRDIDGTAHCVIDIANGKSSGDYAAYEKQFRDAVAKTSGEYLRLLARYEKLKADYAALQIRRDDLITTLIPDAKQRFTVDKGALNAAISTRNAILAVNASLSSEIDQLRRRLTSLTTAKQAFLDAIQKADNSIASRDRGIALAPLA